MGKILCCPDLMIFSNVRVELNEHAAPKKNINVYPKVDLTSLRPKCSWWFLIGIVASKMMIDYIGHKDRMPSFLKMSENFLCQTKGLMQNDVLQVGVFFSLHMLQVAILTPNTLFAEAQFECKPTDGKKAFRPYFGHYPQHDRWQNSWVRWKLPLPPVTSDAEWPCSRDSSDSSAVFRSECWFATTAMLAILLTSLDGVGGIQNK